MSYARTGSVLAQSSPEPEGLGAVVLCSETLCIQGLLSFWGFETEAVIEADASSAIAMASRRGVGRVRHLDLKWLWFQQLVFLEKVRLVNVSGQDHVADVGTKRLPPDVLNKYWPLYTSEPADEPPC